MQILIRVVRYDCCVHPECRDKLALKAAKDGTDNYAALEKKAQLYEKLVRGELSDEEDKEKYCLDFFRKGFMQEEKQDPHEGKPSAVELSGNENANDEHKRLVRIGVSSVGICLVHRLVSIFGTDRREGIRLPALDLLCEASLSPIHQREQNDLKDALTLITWTDLRFSR
ncbi:hypothetical protein AKJ16_DCAP20900 [Drosera capensis]